MWIAPRGKEEKVPSIWYPKAVMMILEAVCGETLVLEWKISTLNVIFLSPSDWRKSFCTGLGCPVRAMELTTLKRTKLVTTGVNVIGVFPTRNSLVPYY